MSQTYTHWKKLHNPDYLGTYALQPGEEPILTISKVVREIVTGADGKKEECTVAYFKEDAKPMILNVTNCKTIAKITGSNFIEDWIGKRIQLYSATVKAFGEEVEALRVRSKAPQKIKPVLDTSYPGWSAALAALTNGETTIAKLEEKYSLPPESRKLMEDACA